MFHHILIPTDGSALSTAAANKSIALAKDEGAKVTILSVTEPFHILSVKAEQNEYTRPSYERHVRALADHYVAEVEFKAKALGVPCETVQVENDHPYQAIIDAATARGCDLIAMASHGRRGVAALVLGSETMKVLTHSKIPVLVFR